MKIRALVRGVIYCVGGSIFLAALMALYMLFENEEYPGGVFMSVMGVFAVWSLMGGVISFIAAVLIGVPMALLLEKLGMVNWFSAVMIGLLGGVAIGFGIGLGPQVLTPIYGAVCGYFFYRGYGSNKSLQPTASGVG